MSNAIIRFGLDKGNSEKQVFTNGLRTILGGFGLLVVFWPVVHFLPDMAQYGMLIYLYEKPASCLRLHPVCTQRQWNKLVHRRHPLHLCHSDVLRLPSGGSSRVPRLPAGRIIATWSRPLPLPDRQAVELCGPQGPEQEPLAADAPLLPAHDPGPDQLLGHQRIGPVLCP